MQGGDRRRGSAAQGGGGQRRVAGGSAGAVDASPRCVYRLSDTLVLKPRSSALYAGDSDVI